MNETLNSADVEGNGAVVLRHIQVDASVEFSTTCSGYQAAELQRLRAGRL